MSLGLINKGKNGTESLPASKIIMQTDMIREKKLKVTNEITSTWWSITKVLSWMLFHAYAEYKN